MPKLNTLPIAYKVSEVLKMQCLIKEFDAYEDGTLPQNFAFQEPFEHGGQTLSSVTAVKIP